MNRRIKKIIALGCTLTLISIVSTGFADGVLDTACANYLSYSDANFNTLISVNPDKAKTIATTLAACETQNACANITNNDTCSTVLASRAFSSDYRANYTATEDRPGNPSSGGLGANAPLPHSPNNIIAPPITRTDGGQQQQTTPAQKTNTKSTSSVHWF